jgi:hypothetical protein
VLAAALPVGVKPSERGVCPQISGLPNRLATARWALRGNCGPNSMYPGAERRMTPRHRSLKAGMIAFEQDFLVKCRIWDLSPSGVGLFVTTAVELPPEFDLTFDYATRHCVTVWREFNRIGLKYKSMH